MVRFDSSVRYGSEVRYGTVWYGSVILWYTDLVCFGLRLLQMDKNVLAEFGRMI